MKRDTMTEKKANEATWALVKSFQETNQGVVQSCIAAQERNTKFAQSFFSEGMEILKASQAAAEGIVLSPRADELKVVIIRPFNHTGSGQDERFIIPSFAAQIARIEQGLQVKMQVGNLCAERFAAEGA